MKPSAAKKPAKKSAKPAAKKAAKPAAKKAAKPAGKKTAKVASAKPKAAAKPAKAAKPTTKVTAAAKPAATTATAAKPATKATKAAKSSTSTASAKQTAASAKQTAKPSTNGTAAKATKPAKAKAKAKSGDEIMVAVTMWEPVMPIDRGERYEDPLFDILEKAGLGGPGDGGGTLTGKEGEIEQIDFDVTISSFEAIPLITKHLEAAGAPKGSVLRYEKDGEDVEVSFGVSEGIAVYLDGITQPPEIYQSTSAQELVDKLLAAAPTLQLRGSWQGPAETALYLYSSNADEMWSTVEPVLRDYPLSRNARVVLRHGNPENNPVEVRLDAN